MDGLALTIGSGALGAICGVVGSWIKARYSKTAIEPNPLCVQKTQSDKNEKICEAAKKNFQERIDDLDRRLSRLEGKIPLVYDSITRIDEKMDKVILRARQ